MKHFRLHFSGWLSVVALMMSLGSVSMGLAQERPSASAPESAPAPTPRAGWNFSDLARVPVQSGGRMKPLETLAEEYVLLETGTRHYQGWKPVELMLSWIAMPQLWENQAFLKINHKDVRRQLGLDEGRSRFSPRELYHHSHIAQYAQVIIDEAQPGARPSLVNPPQSSSPKGDSRKEEMKRVVERLNVFHAIASGDAWPVIPAEVADQKWESLASSSLSGKNEEAIRSEFAEMVGAYVKGDQNKFESASARLRERVEKKVPGWTEDTRRSIAMEALYNESRPFYYGWILYLIAAIAWVFGIFGSGRFGRGAKIAAFSLTIFAGAVHVYGMVLRSLVAGRPPVTNMYESVVWVSLGIMVFGWILYAMNRQSSILAVATALAWFSLLTADSAPAVLDPTIHPLVPVLRSNYWLTIHVLTITLSYAAFALSLGLANVTLFQYLKKKAGYLSKVTNFNQLAYRSMQFGVVLLAAGTILGGVWADYSWGRFWGWDPKEVWALVALLAYIAILHGRFAGWVGSFGFAAWTIVSFVTVVMAWYGVNFVLGVGLHSYGFSTGGRGWVAAFVTLQLGYVIGVTLVHKAKRGSYSSSN